MKKRIAVISPVYNEQDNIQELFERIKTVMGDRFDWQLIFVDDGSADETKQMIKNVCNKDSRVKGILLSKNYGHQIALTAGYDATDAEAVITLDGDLQHPPEVIPEMLSLWEQGNKIVFGVRKDSRDLSWFKKITSKTFYFLLKKFSNINLIAGAADFRLVDQKALRYLKQYREANRFLRGIVSDIGLRSVVLNYQQEERKAGRSKYSLSKMIKLAVWGVVSFSTFPLRISTVIGLVVSTFSFLYAALIVYLKLVYGTSDGVASTLVGIFFIGGIQLISIGILGEYIASIFKEVKKRPLYCIDEVVN